LIQTLLSLSGIVPRAANWIKESTADQDDTITASNAEQASPDLTRPQPEAVTEDLAPDTECLPSVHFQRIHRDLWERYNADTTQDVPEQYTLRLPGHRQWLQMTGTVRLITSYVTPSGYDKPAHSALCARTRSRRNILPSQHPFWIKPPAIQMALTAAELELQNMYKGLLPSLRGQLIASTAAGGPQSSGTPGPTPPPAAITPNQPSFVPGALAEGAQKRRIATPQTQPRRQTNKGAKGKGRGDRQGRNNPPWNQQPVNPNPEPGANMSSWLQNPQILYDLIRLVMRHEQQLMRLGQDTTILFTFQNRPGQVENLLPHLWRISQAWKERMDSDEVDQRPKMSLRVTVLQSVILEIRTRTQAILQKPECQAPLIKKGWLREDHTWPYLQWDAAQQDLVPQPLQRHMSQADLEGLLAELQENVSSEGALFRFQAHRQLAEEMTGHQLTFQAEIGLRSPGALQLHNNLLRLANLSALQLIGLRVHVPRLQLSTLAQTLQGIAAATQFDGIWEARLRRSARGYDITDS
ncbi:Pol, partial [Symbiodinium sp. KB8]